MDIIIEPLKCKILKRIPLEINVGLLIHEKRAMIILTIHHLNLKISTYRSINPKK